MRMWKVRLLIFLITLAFVASVGYIVSLLARGYRFDSKTLSFRPSGLFVVTSVPDGAQIFISGELESATNATLSLLPGSYSVEVKNDGHLPWKKQLVINKEEVTKVEAYLFPAAPSLSALTFAGAQKPLLSPDGTKIVYGVAENDKLEPEKVGIWVMDIVDLPVGFSREPRMITDLDPANTAWHWSPDAREILLTTGQGNYLVPSGTLTKKTSLTTQDELQITKLLEKWTQEKTKKNKDAISRLPDVMQDILKDKTKSFVFSPDGKKLLYTASEDVNIPDKLSSPLPGSSTQKQERTIIAGKTYIYDIKEDRNFLIYEGDVRLANEIQVPEIPQKEEPTDQKKQTPTKAKKLSQKPTISVRQAIYWFPTSGHVVLAEDNKITIMDYDGTNKQTIYAGPYETPYAIPFPNTSRLLILTNLAAGDGISPNLYSINLR